MFSVTNSRILFFISIVLLFSCHWKNKSELSNSELIDELKRYDRQLEKPKDGEWLFEHKEPGQTLEQFKAAHPIKPNTIQNTIYLLPLGNFSFDQKNLIIYTADYLTLYFGIKTVILPALSDDAIPEGSKRTRKNGSTQLFAPYILNEILKERMPKNAIVLMAITEKDLYHKPSWNFVFGLASFKERVGVSSIYRYSNKTIDSLDYALCLGRLISTSSHEIGHMFSMHHCTYAVCVMNGSNNLSESDSKPNRLCSQCLGKLRWNLGFDLRKRLLALDSFFVRHQLTRDYKASHADLALIQ